MHGAKNRACKKPAGRGGCCKASRPAGDLPCHRPARFGAMRQNRAGPPHWWPRMNPKDPKRRRGDPRDPTRRRKPMVRHETPPGQGGPSRSQRRPPGHGTRQQFLTDCMPTKTRLKNRHKMHTFHAKTGKVKKERVEKKGGKMETSSVKMLLLGGGRFCDSCSRCSLVPFMGKISITSRRITP